MSDLLDRLNKCLNLYSPNPEYLKEQIADAIDEIELLTSRVAELEKERDAYAEIARDALESQTVWGVDNDR